MIRRHTGSWTQTQRRFKPFIRHVTGWIGAECHKFICPAEQGKCPVTDLGQTLDNAERVLLTTSGDKRDVFKTVVTVKIAGRDHLLESFVDITARKQAEEMLRNSEGKYRALFDDAADAHLLTDEKGLLDCNAAALRMFGYSTKSELIALHPAEFSPETQPDGTDSRFDSEQKIAAAIRNGSARFEWMHMRKNGELFPAEICMSAIMLSSGPAMLGTIRDLTERRRSEESLKLFRTLIDQASDAIEVVDPATSRYIDVNERTCRSLGYTREEMLSMFVFDVDLHTKEMQNRVEEGFREKGFARFESEHRRKDGSVFPVEVELRLVQLDRAYVVSTARDMTERKLTLQKLSRSEARLALRNRLADIFLTVPDDKMFDEVLNVVMERMSSTCGLFGFTDEQGSLVIPSLCGQIWKECKMDGKNLCLPREAWGGAWGRALIEKVPFVSNQLGQTPDGHVPILRYLVTPILHMGQAIGVLAVANKSTDYDDPDKEMLEDMAGYLAPVLHARLQRDAQELARKHAEETIESLARTDPLTGLANRRVLDETLPRETARAKRLQGSLALIFADLDQFKSINDRFGHQAGDQVLAAVGAILQRNLRSYALATRFGGDEFVLLLPGTTKDGAIIVAERIREKVAVSTVPDCPSPFTLSLGVATFEAGESGAELLARADKALYRAKKKGGDRVEVA